MEVIAKQYQDQLGRIKKSIRNAHDYFKPNYDRFNEFRQFVFDTSLREEEVTLLMTMSRPTLEFNILEAYVSRLMGEFSKQEPDIAVNADNENSADPVTIKVVEQHLRQVLLDQKNHHTRYEVYKDLLSGGFSTLKVVTKYRNPMSFEQDIDIVRAYDPTMCGFDSLARYSHKGDGRFCFELTPMSKDDFQDEYPEVPVEDLNFRRDFAGFNWSYLSDNQQVIIVGDYYEKKKKKVKIVQLNNKKVMKKKEYDHMLATWGDFQPPPAIVGEPRWTEIDKIVRYRMIENHVLEYVETDFSHLPLIFVDGNSMLIRTQKNGNIHQHTRPYVYHAKDAQRLKNWAGISLANEIENMVQHKFMVAKEALPKEEDFMQAYKDVQKANVLVYNSFFEQNPDQPISNPIREIAKVPAPPEIAQTFNGTDSLIQNILGSYDASLGINNNQLSGIAIVEGATQSNATAMPYIVGYLQGYQRAAEIYVDLMPKYYKTPRTLPIMDEEGKRSYVKINQENGLELEYDANVLNVVVKAGASFQVQKSRTIMMVKEMMGMSPIFAQFIAEKGLTFVLDNLEGRGIEQLKQGVEEFVQELDQQKKMMQQQQQQMMQQQQGQPNPAMMHMQIEQQKLEHESMKAQGQFAVDMAKLRAAQEKVLADMQQSKQDNAMEMAKLETERFAKEIDLRLQHKDMEHRHLKDAVEVHHKVSMDKQKGKEHEQSHVE